MTRRRPTRIFASLALLAPAFFPTLFSLSACGGASAGLDPSADGGGEDSPTPFVRVPAATDAHAEASLVAPLADSGSTRTYPAPHAPMPVVGYLGGPLLLAERVVTITFDNEPEAPWIQGFDDAILQSPYWTTITSPYCIDSQHCVGSGSSGGHVTLHESPTGNLGLSSVTSLLQSHIIDGTLPPPTPDTLYAVYYPPGALVSETGFAGCVDFDAYHDSTTVNVPPALDAGPNGASSAVTPTPITYAVMLRCNGGNDELTLAAGHELIEAATDPFSSGFKTLDPAFAGFFYPEVGDLCDYEPTLAEAGYTVQRIWSNASAEMGHNPCIPIPAGEVYFNAAPSVSSVELTVGESTTLDVIAFSDGPTRDWTLGAFDNTAALGNAPLVNLSLDTTTVNNGTKAKLTIQLLRSPDGSDALFVISSIRGGVQRYWPARVMAK